MFIKDRIFEKLMPYRMGVADFEEALKKDAGIPPVSYTHLDVYKRQIYVVGKSQEQQNRTNAKLNAMTYTERIYGELMEGIGAVSYTHL